MVHNPQDAAQGLEFEKLEKTLRNGELGGIFNYLTKHGLMPSSYELDMQHLQQDWIEVNNPSDSQDFGKG